MLYSSSQRLKSDSNYGKSYKNSQYSFNSLPNALTLIQKYQIKVDKNDITSKKNKKKVAVSDDTPSDLNLKDIKDDQGLWTPSTCLFIESIGSNDKNNQNQPTQQQGLKGNYKESNINESNSTSYINSTLIESSDSLKNNSMNLEINAFEDINNKNEKVETGTEKNKTNKAYSKNDYFISTKEPSERYTYLKIEDNGQERINLNRKNLYSCVHISGEERVRLLNYQNNFISRIECLSNFRNLIFLDFFNNNIERIQGLDNLNSLRVLMLGRNKITKIEGLSFISKLDVLDLHDNEITEIDISFEKNPISVVPLYRPTVIFKFRYIKILDGHRVSEEEKRLSYKITKKEEEKRKENERITQKNEEKKKSINNIQEIWKHKMRIIHTNSGDNGVVDLKCLKNSISVPLDQNNKNNSSGDSNSNNNLKKNITGSATSTSRSLLNLSDSTIHYSSSSLFNSRDSLVSPKTLSSKNSYLNLNKNINNKGRNIMNSSNQKLISANDMNNTLTSYIEQDKDEIRLYGDINVNFDKLDVSGIKTISFHYVHINSIIDIMDKLKKFTDLRKLIFSNNDFSSFNQLHSFSILRNIEEIDILSYDNPIVKYDNLVYYILYRLKHLPLKIVCNKKITEADYENAELMFAGLQKVILKIPTNIIYHTSDLTLPINFTGTVCPMIKQYKSKYMNLETLTTLRKNKNSKEKISLNNMKVRNNGGSTGNKVTNKNNDSNGNNNSTIDKKDKNSIQNTSSSSNDSKKEISTLPPSYMKNVIQQYVQLNSLFVMVTQENISIRNKLMESGNFLKYNQFFSLPINIDNEDMEINYKKCKNDAKDYVNKLIKKSKEEQQKSELFSKFFSRILADDCQTILQNSNDNDINQSMEEALINIIQN
jgi:hypothetical protein